MTKEILLNVLQYMATVFGLLQGLLIIFKVKENWIFLFAQSITYVVWALGFNLWADVIEQGIYILLAVLGFSIWYQKFRSKLFEVDIHHISLQNASICLNILIILTFIFYKVLIKTNDPFPFLDAITTSIGFVATFLMARKVIECWVLWFISDVLGIYIYMQLGANGLMFLNVVWMAMAFISFATWNYCKRSS